MVAAAFMLISAFQSSAVVDQRLEVQGTNLVLSWPSSGTEHYLIQFRPSFDPADVWETLTNNFPANSTNRSTFVIPCCLLPPSVAENSGGGGSSGDGPPTPGQSMAENAFGESENGTELWAVQESGSAVPFILFPPGIDTSNLKIFEVEKSQKRAVGPGRIVWRRIQWPDESIEWRLRLSEHGIFSGVSRAGFLL